MKIKTFDLAPGSGKKGMAPRIRLIPSGLITLNGTLCEKLGLEVGSGVDFHQDEDEPKDWYISVNPGSYNKLRKKETGALLMFNNVRLVQAIMSSACPDISFPTVGFFVAKESIKMPGIKSDCFAIITSSAKK